MEQYNVEPHIKEVLLTLVNPIELVGDAMSQSTSDDAFTWYDGHDGKGQGLAYICQDGVVMVDSEGTVTASSPYAFKLFLNCFVSNVIDLVNDTMSPLTNNA